MALIEGVRHGYFDPGKIEKHAQELHDKLIATKAHGSFEDAWRLYHDSFDDNQGDILDTIYASFMNNFRYISQVNLNGTVTLFKDLKRQDMAREMVNHYVDNRNEPLSFFDLENDLWLASDLNIDPDIRKAFDEKRAALEEKLDVPAMLLTLKVDLRSDKVLSELATVSVEEYRKAFKETRGKDLQVMLAGVLQFGRIANASPEMKEIFKRAREALKLIGAESPINARRVAKFGIRIEGVAEEARDKP